MSNAEGEDVCAPPSPEADCLIVSERAVDCQRTRSGGHGQMRRLETWRR
ncbi:MAG: hypothetical protein LBD30_00535 [Verrucomicrobiales bacterium]|nr:hypothetical protein [Verrucomicrobiales bacterium]